jgi:hypothetical protein
VAGSVAGELAAVDAVGVQRGFNAQVSSRTRSGWQSVVQ